MDPLEVPASQSVTLAALRENEEYNKRKEAFEELIAMVPFKVGKLVSLEAREARGIPEDQFHPLVYGETEFDSIAYGLARLKNTYGISLKGKVYYDIGCGTGKPVFAAALLDDSWDECVGIEILDDLVRVAENELMTQWEDGLPYLPRGSKNAVFRIPSSCRNVPIRFLVGDATKPESLSYSDGTPATEDTEAPCWDWGRRADVVYVCATCFDEETMRGLQIVADRMKPGSIFFSSGCTVEGPRWRQLEATECTFSWGQGTLFICQRTEEP